MVISVCSGMVGDSRGGGTPAFIDHLHATDCVQVRNALLNANEPSPVAGIPPFHS